MMDSYSDRYHDDPEQNDDEFLDDSDIRHPNHTSSFNIETPPRTASRPKHEQKRFSYICTFCFVLFGISMVIAAVSLFSHYFIKHSSSNEVPNEDNQIAWPSGSYGDDNTGIDNSSQSSSSSSLSSSSPSSSSSLSSSPNQPQKDHEPTVLESLREELLPISGQVLFNTSSAQYQALEWLAENGPVPNSTLVDAYVLSLLYFSSDGPSWKLRANFMNATVSVCDWHISSAKGAYCGDDPDNPGHVSKIELTRYFLKGTIPSELSHLHSLSIVGLEHNDFISTIPTELGTLTKIKKLALTGNQLSGTIPTELGNIGSESKSQNTLLTLAKNNLVGTIPTELGNIVLRFLLLDRNSLTGTIPSELGNSETLSVINLSYNQLRGSIPKELGEHMERLGYLWLQHNLLSGEVPSELGNLNNELFETLHLYSNQLTGTLPTQIGRLHSLETVKIQDNNIVGNIDHIFCQPTYVGSGEVSISVVFKNTFVAVADSCSGNYSKVKCDCCCCTDCDEE